MFFALIVVLDYMVSFMGYSGIVKLKSCDLSPRKVQIEFSKLDNIRSGYTAVVSPLRNLHCCRYCVGFCWVSDDLPSE